MTEPTTPADLIAQAAQRHQNARDAAQAVSEEIAAKRAQEAAQRATARAAQESGR